MTDCEILELPIPQPNDAGAATIREYLKALLEALWTAEQGFSGKRPFGNSGWTYDVYPVLIKAGLVRGILDADGYIDECDDKEALKVMIRAIKAL